MDPITEAVVAALGKLAEPAVRDTYDALKALIIRKFGPEADVTKAVATLEARPESAARQEFLAEELARGWKSNLRRPCTRSFIGDIRLRKIDQRANSIGVWE
jgi:hypothetical protein